MKCQEAEVGAETKRGGQGPETEREIVVTAKRKKNAIENKKNQEVKKGIKIEEIEVTAEKEREDIAVRAGRKREDIAVRVGREREEIVVIVEIGTEKLTIMKETIIERGTMTGRIEREENGVGLEAEINTAGIAGARVGKKI